MIITFNKDINKTKNKMISTQYYASCGPTILKNQINFYKLFTMFSMWNQIKNGMLTKNK